MSQRLLLIGLLLVTATPSLARTSLIGTPAPPFKLQQWLNSKPLEVKDLKGQVVLVRFWTDTCPYCAGSAPALNELQAKYGPKGLRVIGIFHPKPPETIPGAFSSINKGSFATSTRAGPIIVTRPMRTRSLIRITLPWFGPLKHGSTRLDEKRF